MQEIKKIKAEIVQRNDIYEALETIIHEGGATILFVGRQGGEICYRDYKIDIKDNRISMSIKTFMQYAEDFDRIKEQCLEAKADISHKGSYEYEKLKQAFELLQPAFSHLTHTINKSADIIIFEEFDFDL